MHRRSISKKYPRYYKNHKGDETQISRDTNVTIEEGIKFKVYTRKKTIVTFIDISDDISRMGVLDLFKEFFLKYLHPKIVK